MDNYNNNNYDKNTNNNKINNFKRSISFIKVNFYILIKKLLEYKSNIYFVLLEQFVFIFVSLTLFSIIQTNFGDLIGWSYNDFILFMIITDFLEVIMGIVLWRNWLKEDITNGKFNNFLLRPINSYVFRFFYDLNQTALVYIILNLFTYSGFIIYFNIELMNLFLGFLIFILLIIYSILFVEFISSFDFILLGVSEYIARPYFTFDYNLKKFPANFFMNSKFKYIIMPFSNFFVVMLLMPVLTNKEIWKLNLQLSVLFSLILIFIIGIFINWHYGLKKYEAFG